MYPLKSTTFALAAAALCLTATPAHATPITYVATGELENGSVLSGTVVIDGVVLQSFDVTLTGPFSFSQHAATNPAPADTPGAGTVLQVFALQTVPIDGNSLQLFLKVTSPSGLDPSGSEFCFEAGCGPYISRASIGGPSGTFIWSDFTSGSLTPVPEPASIALFGGALAGVALLRRYRPTAADRQSV